MPYMTPLPRDEIKDPELLALIERAERLGVPDSLFPLILARVPAYAKAIMRALLTSHAEGAVDHKLKEIIRILLARRAGDRYFAGLRSSQALDEGLDESTIAAGVDDYERSARFTEAEKWALRYADQMYLNPDGIDAEFYAGMKKHYTEAQIMELGAFIAFHYGMQVFMRTLNAGLESKSR